jgi:cardiolipin synthase A/B
VFRRRDLTLMRRDEWDKRMADYQTVIIPAPAQVPADAGVVSALIEALFDEDEQLVRVDVGDQPPAERLALFAVRKGAAEGLPPRVTAHLKLELEKASRKAAKPGAAPQGPVEVKVAPRVPNMRPERQTHVRRDDVIAGGPAHQAHILNTLKKAREFVVIHSTFLDKQRFEDLLPAFRTAAARRCKVDILWGESPQVRTETAKALKESAAIRERIHQAGLSGLVEVHNFSTRSHSKLLIGDDGAGAVTATIGSCNWLSSGYGSFELSFRLRDPQLVADALSEAIELARPPDQQIPDIAARLGELTRGLRRRAPLQGSARVRVLVGEEHDDRVLQARDQAQSQITVLSHRLGVTARPSILVPVASAVAARKITASLFYGQSSGTVNEADASDTRWQMRDEGVELVAVKQPRLHAKALMWDDDHVAISSMNWLSADTPPSNPRQEMGVYIEANGLARQIGEEFKNARMLA